MCSLNVGWDIHSDTWWLSVLPSCKWRTSLLPCKPSPAFMSDVSYLKKEDNKSGLKLLQDFGILFHAGVEETCSQDQYHTE